MNKLKKIRFEVLSENILNDININQIEFGNLNFYSKGNRQNNINITTDLNLDLINYNISTNIPKIHKIVLQGISGTYDQNPDIREFEFIGLGKWGSGDRRQGDYKIDVSTNITTAQYPLSPTVYLNNWVDGLITSSPDDNSKYLSGNNVQITSTSYISFNFVGTASKPNITDLHQFLIYYDRQDISIDSNQGKWKLIVIDENGYEHTVISTMTFYENKLITDYSNIYFLKFDTNIKSYYQNTIINTNTNNYNYLIDGNYNNNLLSIKKNNSSKFIEFDLDLSYNTPYLLNALSYTKIYWNNNNIIYTEERLYPPEKARFHYFDKIDGYSPDVYHVKHCHYANGYYEIKYSTNYHTNEKSPHYVFSSKNTEYHNDATWENNQYNNGKYIGTYNFGNLGYKGDWITIKMPIKIIPTKIRFVSILLDSNHTNKLPKKYRLYGYYDNKWEIILNDTIDDDYEFERYNSVNNIAYTKTITNCKNYNNFLLIVNEINGANVLAMSNFEIFGKEIVNNCNDIFSLTGFNNWLKIKHLPPRTAGSAWYSGDTFSSSTIYGTYDIGNRNDDSQEWAISFNPEYVEYYLFITRDSDYNSEFKDRWVMIESDEMKKYSTFNYYYEYSYSSTYIHHYKSSINPNGFQDKTGDFYEFKDQIMNNKGGAYTDDPYITLLHSKTYGTYTYASPYSYNHHVFIDASSTHYWGPPPVVCEVYVKYKEVNINELYYTNKIHRLQYDAESITKLDGWKLVRYLHNGMNAAFKSTDNLVGTDVYGNKDDFTQQWSIEFQSGNYDQYLFVGGNFEDWIIIHKDEFIPLNGSYNNYITALKSSINDNEHLVKAATDTPNDRPLIALTEWGDNKHLYQESETGSMQFGNGTYADRPYYVFVRKTIKNFISNTNTNETIYTDERMYPPVRNLESNQHTISNQLYGNGLYECNQSESYDIRDAYSAFNTTISAGPRLKERYVNGVYNFSPPKYLVSDYYGDWITIKMPFNIILTKYGFKQRNGDNNPNRAPGKYKIYGSNDGIIWNELVNKKSTISYNNLEFEEYVSINDTYNHFGLVVNTLVGNDTNDTSLSFDEWYIYGKEIYNVQIYINITNDLQYNVEQLTEKKGWRIVRYLPPYLGRWYSGNYFTYNNMEVTDSIGIAYDYGSEFMLPFGNYDEIFFSTYDMTYWLYTTKEAVLGYYSNQDRNVLKSSSNPNLHTVKWYNRPDNNEDPWISINDHSSYQNLMLYGENYNYGHYSLVPNHGGMCVFVRTSTDTNTYNLESEEKIISLINDGGEKSHTNYELILNNDTMCDVLIVGGGGGGGQYGGGGGGGDVIYKENIILNSGSYKIKVGKGGLGGGSEGRYIPALSGNSSSLELNSSSLELNENFNIIAGGGGGGHSYFVSANVPEIYTYKINGISYYSQGGGGGGAPAPIQYTTSYGSFLGNISNYSGDGGSGNFIYGSGGGGGSHGNGASYRRDTIYTYVSYSGNGGRGTFIDITGENTGYGGGGGGGFWNSYGNYGVGYDGGGDGGNYTHTYPKNGVNGKGGGGGGGGNFPAHNGANGGAGIVIIKIKYIYNYNYNNVELKTSLIDSDNNVINLNNTIINPEYLIHGLNNGILSSYNITKYTLFKEERLYPPYYKSDILLFENFFIENKIYGNGKYSIKYSSQYDNNNTPLNIFRNNYYNGKWKFNNYKWNDLPLNTLLARSFFEGITYLSDSSYKGDWITIDLPYNILLTKFLLVLMNSNTLDISTYNNAVYYFPHKFRIYGKNDNEDWELIIEKNINKDNLNNKYDNINNLDVAYEFKFSDNDRLTKFKTFNKYGLVVSEIGGKEYLNFSKWDIYGRELNTVLDNKPDNIPSKKNIKFSQLSKVFDDKYDNKNINITNYYLDNLNKYSLNTRNQNIPNDGLISLSNFKNTSSHIDNVPLPENIFARYEVKYEYLQISNNVVTTWYDSSGNNNHITTYRGTPIVKQFEQGKKGTVGNNYFNVLYGNINSGYKLPFRLNSDFTFCYVARYVGDKNNTTYNRRIFDSSAGTGANTIWGFNNNKTGLSKNYKTDWYTTQYTQHSEPDYWMIGIETQNTARYNGQDCTNYYTYNNENYPIYYSDYSTELTINYGFFTGDPYHDYISNWEVAELIFYNKELSLDEKKSVEKYLAKKYGHISFSNVVNNLDEYKSIIKSNNYKSDLSDLWYYVYDGYKYGYSNLTDKFYGPVNNMFSLYKFNDTTYYWIMSLENINFTQSGSTYDNRNDYNQIYNINIMKTNGSINIVALGGGGGGGGIDDYYIYRYWFTIYTIFLSSGGGAGGQAFIYNYMPSNDINLTLEIGARGSGDRGGTNKQDSSGGDSIVTWNDNGISYNIVGRGGYEGVQYYHYGIGGYGGSYFVSPSSLSNIGGDAGGNSIVDKIGSSVMTWRFPGGKISEILNNITLNSSVKLWDVIDEFFINWRSINVIQNNDVGKYYGAGGPGAHEQVSSTLDPNYARRKGGNGGPGVVFVIIDPN